MENSRKHTHAHTRTLSDGERKISPGKKNLTMGIRQFNVITTAEATPTASTVLGTVYRTHSLSLSLSLTRTFEKSQSVTAKDNVFSSTFWLTAKLLLHSLSFARSRSHTCASKWAYSLSDWAPAHKLNFFHHKCSSHQRSCGSASSAQQTWCLCGPLYEYNNGGAQMPLYNYVWSFVDTAQHHRALL